MEASPQVRSLETSPRPAKRDMQAELEAWRQARREAASSKGQRPFANTRRAIREKENDAFVKVPPPLTPQKRQGHLNAVSPLAEICQNASPREVCVQRPRRLPSPLQVLPAQPWRSAAAGLSSTLQVLEESHQVPRAPPSSPRSPFAEELTRPHPQRAVEAVLLAAAELCASETLSEGLSTPVTTPAGSPEKAFSTPGRISASSPPVKPRVAQRVEALEVAPARCLEWDDAEAPTSSPETLSQENEEEVSEELRLLLTQRHELLSRFLRLEEELNQPGQEEDTGRTARLHEELTKLKEAHRDLEAKAASSHELEFRRWRRRVRSHRPIWPLRTALDMEDHLSRSHDIYVFWFFEARDRVSSAVPDFKPLAPKLEPVPEDHALRASG